MHVRWSGSDAARDRVALAAVLGVDIPDEGPIDIPGLRLEIVAPGPGRTRGRLDVVGMAPGASAVLSAHRAAEAAAEAAFEAGSAASAVAVGRPTERFAGPAHPVSPTARFIALGWATVDLERSAARWPGMRWRTAPRDALVGARAHVGRTGTPAEFVAAQTVPAETASLVLLEPDTEGRLAASLARHGEGPAALYVRVPRDAIAAIAARMARLGVRFIGGPGPFGSAWAMAGPDASSPTVIVVPGALSDE